jgi:hypothetical protein
MTAKRVVPDVRWVARINWGRAPVIVVEQAAGAAARKNVVIKHRVRRGDGLHRAFPGQFGDTELSRKIELPAYA